MVTDDLTQLSGSANLATRAELSGGSFSVAKGEEGGTVVRWSAPLPWSASPST
ncbi:hypothetical protein [Nocardia sp. NPDC051463]|uniref:hypothetical protein n=1 Tax=Nocardia sp. NPDC051463 TaxID=3154845 RepID=UPI00344B1B4D